MLTDVLGVGVRLLHHRVHGEGVGQGGDGEHDQEFEDVAEEHPGSVFNSGFSSGYPFSSELRSSTGSRGDSTDVQGSMWLV